MFTTYCRCKIAGVGKFGQLRIWSYQLRLLETTECYRFVFRWV